MADAPRSTSAHWIDRLTAALAALLSLWIFSAPLRSHGDLLPFAQDDFYYYLQAARNLVAGHGSTFDGSTPTNGYHPLYFLLLCAASSITGSLRGIFRFLWLLDAVSATCVFLLVRRMVRERLADPLIENGLAAIAFYLAVFMLSEQMEVTLTLPLGFLFLLLVLRPARTPQHFALVGMAAALLTLSRLDAVLMVMAAACVTLLLPEQRRAVGSKGLLALAAGYLPPVLLYFGVNLHFFHRAMPISGTAKQLRHTHAMHLLHVFAMAAGKTRLMFALSLAGALLLALLWRRLRPSERVAYSSALAFPFLHWAAVLLLSDWPMWGWYSYGLRFSLAVTFLLGAFLLSMRLAGRMRRALSYGIFALGIAAMLLSHYRVDPEMVQVAAAAEQVRAFAATHPGRYAMGDRAGMVGYRDGVPTLQLEGLMEDGAFLDHIRQRDPLQKVLDAYRIDYYIGFRRTPAAACFDAVEPANAGPDSAVMRGRFCQPPLAAFDLPAGTTLIYNTRAPIRP